MVAIKRLRHKVANSIRLGYLANGDEGAETVHWDWPLIFNSVAALDMLLLSFLKQFGPRGHTNSHGFPHFSFLGDPVEVHVRRVIERGHQSCCVSRPARGL